MSSIFNGDSIYKSGGGSGGGGYKDGGELVDADFIKVENNTVSYYDNVNRDPVNFYFEPKDGEILNSIIEMTTAVNSTVNVYILKNGIYYSLGNIGSNTVNSGDDYKINITGDSFSIEQVSNSLEIAFVEIYGVNVPVKKIGNLYWTTQNVDIPGSNKKFNYGQSYYKRESFSQNVNINGFRIPNSSDTDALKLNGRNAICSQSGWSSNQGTNTTGFNLYPYGSYNSSGTFQGYSYYGYIYTFDGGPLYCGNDGTIAYAAASGWYPMRLCKDV